MSITRRAALAAALGCGLTTTPTGADEKPAAKGPPPRDPVLSLNLPPAIRKAFEDTFPNHRCIRLGTRGRDEAAVYRGTFFDPANWSSATGGLVDGESVVTPPLYHLELDAAAKVLEETHRPIDPKQLPKAVQAAYEKWNPKGVTGQEHFWLTEVARGKARVYQVAIILSAVKAYRASFREDGTVVKADPAVVP
jgi:hypothetical protein